MNNKYVTSLEISKLLKEASYPQESQFWWINSSYSSGFEGGDIIWLCDNKWTLLDFIPDKDYHDTGRITKKEGLIPDYCKEKYIPYESYRKEIEEKITNIEYVSASIASELIKILPYRIKIKNGFRGFLNIHKRENDFEVAYRDGKGECIYFEDDKYILVNDQNLCNTLAKMYLYLKNNKL